MGGKFFKDQNGQSKTKRIPKALIYPITNEIIKEFSSLFDKMEMIISAHSYQKKEDHGDIDFICLLYENEDEFYNYVKVKNIQYGSNGPMRHIIYYYNNQPYQIDFIVTGDPEQYEIYKFFYSKDLAFNSVIGHFARSIGYKFSTRGLMLHITDKRKQNRNIVISKDLKKIFELLMIEEPSYEYIFEKPENFAKWIMTSPRFDTELFKSKHNTKAHRDAYRDPFCNKIYKILFESNIKAKYPPTIIKFNKEDVNIKEKLKIESQILKEDIYEKIIKTLEKYDAKIQAVVNGKDLITMGFKQGPIIGKILSDINCKFNNEKDKEKILKYIRKKYIKEN